MVACSHEVKGRTGMSRKDFYPPSQLHNTTRLLAEEDHDAGESITVSFTLRKARIHAEQRIHFLHRHVTCRVRALAASFASYSYLLSDSLWFLLLYVEPSRYLRWPNILFIHSSIHRSVACRTFLPCMTRNRAAGKTERVLINLRGAFIWHGGDH